MGRGCQVLRGVAGNERTRRVGDSGSRGGVTDIKDSQIHDYNTACTNSKFC